MNVRTKFEVCSFTLSWDRGYSKKLTVPGYAHAPFSAKFLMGFCTMDPANAPVKFEVRSFTRSWDNRDCSFGWVLRCNLGEEEAVWVGDGIYRPSIVTFPLSSRVSEILPFLCSNALLFPTPPLIFPKFPHVPLGVGGWPLGYEERRCWANCPCN